MNPMPFAAILKNKWLWIIIAILMVVWLVGPHVANAIRRLRTPDRGNYQGQAAPNAADRARIEQMATDMRTELYGIPSWGGRDDVAERILAMNDTEIRYLATYYRQIAEGNRLIDDVQGEWSWTGDTKQRLISKLLQLNA